MGDISIGFDCIEETFWSEVMPPLYRLFLREVIEGVVDFDGVEMLSVVLEPFALRQAGRIKQLLPVVVIPSGCAYSNIAGRIAHKEYFNVLNGFEKGYNFQGKNVKGHSRMDFGPQQFGKWLIAAGIVISLLGVLVIVLGRVGLFKLPGDLEFGSRNWRIYFPIASCIILSIILTLIFWLINHFRR